MKIVVLKDNLLVNTRVCRKGEVLDRELSGEHKKALVERKVADWYQEPEAAEYKTTSVDHEAKQASVAPKKKDR